MKHRKKQRDILLLLAKDKCTCSSRRIRKWWWWIQINKLTTNQINLMLWRFYQKIKLRKNHQKRKSTIQSIILSIFSSVAVVSSSSSEGEERERERRAKNRCSADKINKHFPPRKNREWRSKITLGSKALALDLERWGNGGTNGWRSFPVSQPKLAALSFKHEITQSLNGWAGTVCWGRHWFPDGNL